MGRVYFPAHTGFGHVTCFGCQNIGRYNMNRGSYCACRVWLGLLHFFYPPWKEHIPGSLFSLSPNARHGDQTQLWLSALGHGWLTPLEFSWSQQSLKSDLWTREKCLLFKSLRLLGVDMQRSYEKSWWIHIGDITWKFTNVVGNCSNHLRIKSWQAIAICESRQVSSLQSQLISSVFSLGATLWNYSWKKRKPAAYPSFPFFSFVLDLSAMMTAAAV